MPKVVKAAMVVSTTTEQSPQRGSVKRHYWSGCGIFQVITIANGEAKTSTPTDYFLLVLGGGVYRLHKLVKREEQVYTVVFGPSGEPLSCDCKSWKGSECKHTNAIKALRGEGKA